MNNLDLPPFPVLGTSGPQVCESVRFYLPLIEELSFEQVRILSEHIKECEKCAAEFHLLQQTTHLLTTLPASTPSPRVDDAIKAFLSNQPPANFASVQLHPEKQRSQQRQTQPAGRRNPPFYRRRAAALALVAALLLVLFVVFQRAALWPTASNQAFLLPANLSWNGYVMHYTQAKTDPQGKSYQVEVYQDLGSNQMHIESMMQGTFDVVVVTDQQDMLGKDMMNHVAQEGNGVAPWTVDGSAFDLGQLRQDLAAQRASYLGQSTFAGQQVYQVRTSNGQILLLNKQYLPVNVLNGGLGAGAPIYALCVLMHSAQVSDSMWDMQVPANFHMGALPTKS